MMRSFTSFFKLVPAFSITVLLILIFEFSLYFIPDLYKIDAAGPFFVHYKREIAEDKTKEFDILILGDSRSLSLKAHNKSETNPYSMYNFSLPAAGARYYPFLLKKYLSHHVNKPKLVVWAGDLRQFKKENTINFVEDKKIFNEYKHRLLNLFSFSETWEQYSGQELFFMFRQYLPTYLLTYKFRQGFEVFVGARLESLFKLRSHLRDRNDLITKLAETNNGQINLGTFFFTNEQGFAEKEFQKQSKYYNTEERTMKPLVDFLEYTKKENIPFVVLALPQAKGFYETLFFKTVRQDIDSITKQYSHATYLEFPNMDYDISLFAEAIHYNDKGDSVVNKEFKELVYPQLIKILEEKNAKK
ncbi:MAG: hypothetical protein SFU98_21565 [Leptospiraceae bacterium]|nr:hypothetical protein [Leptospiraceae bacterium]